MRGFTFLLALAICGCEPTTKALPAEPAKPVIYAFPTDWCSQCPRMYPTWRRFEKRNYEVKWIDTDNSKVDEKYGVDRLPSTVIVKDGKAMKFTGVVSYETLDRYLRQ